VALGSFVLAASVLVSQAAAPSPAVFPLALVQPAPAAAQQDPNAPAPIPEFHRFDIGGSMAASTRGAGGSVRVWLTKNIATSLAAAYYRQPSVGGVPSASAFQLTPSVIVMLAPAQAGADLYVRPYVGGGVNYTHLSSALNNANLPANARTSGGMGMQAFGGAEIGGQQLGKMTISAEMAYYRLPVSFSNSPALDGVQFILGLHIFF
jgi:hypothetical protein